MSSEAKRPNEFRRYRQGLTAVYFVVVAVGAFLLIGSIVKQLLFPRPRAVGLSGPKVSAEDPAPEDLLRCNADLQDLLTRPGEVTRDLLKAPTHRGRAEVLSAWEESTRVWWDDYHEVGARCRFSELADARLGAVYDRMAEVYGDLPAMRRKYQELLKQFDDDQAAELAQMRRALDRSRDVLLRREREESSP